MATGTFKWYITAFDKMLRAEVNFTNGMKWFHTSATEVPDQDADDYENDANANEVTGTNLPAGGVALDTPTITVTGATNVVKLDANDYSVASVTVATPIKNSHLVDSTPGAPASNPMLGFIVWDTTMQPNNGTLSIIYDSAGIATITPAA